jgi:hypothetical protein
MESISTEQRELLLERTDGCTSLIENLHLRHKERQTALELCDALAVNVQNVELKGHHPLGQSEFEQNVREWFALLNGANFLSLSIIDLIGIGEFECSDLLVDDECVV